MGRKKKEKEPLAELLELASHEALADLIIELSEENPDIRRECIDFLKHDSKVSETLKLRSEGETVLTLWAELAPDLEELDMYGGGDYGMEDNVADLLYEIQTRLSSNEIEAEVRQTILERVVPYIKSRNSGMSDLLHDVAYAACYDDNELRTLAALFEDMNDSWETQHAMHIYRDIGERDKYLELRMQKMKYGGDYYDLVTFYWESGEKEKALQVAEEGLKKAEGRMTELRNFLADKAKKSGDREKYLSLQFDEATSRLTLETYRSFQKICSKTEWKEYEPRMLERLKDAWEDEQLRIHMHRREYDEAIALLKEDTYPLNSWGEERVVRIARKLEERYPEDILKYYLSGLGNMNYNFTRKEYARKAKVAAKIHRVLVNVIKDRDRWIRFSSRIKQDNIRRPAFQDEFTKAIPEWKDIQV